MTPFGTFVTTTCTRWPDIPRFFVVGAAAEHIRQNTLPEHKPLKCDACGFWHALPDQSTITTKKEKTA